MPFVLSKPRPSFLGSWGSPWLMLCKDFLGRFGFSFFFSVFSQHYLGSVGPENPW